MKQAQYALATERMLAPEVDFEPLIEAWKNRRTMLATQLERLESGKMRSGTNIPDVTTNQDKARLRTWIAEMDALIAEYSK